MSGHSLRLLVLVSAVCLVGVACIGGGLAEGSEQRDPSDADGFENASGTIDVVVELDGLLPEHAAVEPDTLEQASENARQPLEAYAAGTPGVEIRETFWLAPMALVSVDVDRVDPSELTAVPGVTGISENAEFETLATTEPTTKHVEGDTTYGLQQVNATGVWSALNATGTNASVAVIDTGVDVDSHDDLELAPDGWAHFDNEGHQTDRGPFDPDGHGTHVTGTVGGDRLGDDGPQYGVAPDADLYHAGVMEDDRMTLTAVVAAMEWAVSHEADIDVMTMSLGAGTSQSLVAPVQNARAMGLVVTAAAGNSGEGTSLAPGNAYETLAIGATDHERSVALFSSGQQLDTARSWGVRAPIEWPSSYLVPDVTAPGVDVCSALPDGETSCAYSGTSMATPHVAGVAALAADVRGDLDPGAFEVALRETADHPEGDDSDPRYGHGIVDAWAAINYTSATIEGTVTDAETGAGLPNASVGVDTYATGTDDGGTYVRPTTPGNQSVTVQRVGYESVTEQVDPDPGETVTVNTSMDPVLPDGTVREQFRSELPPSIMTRGYLAVAGVETLTLEQRGGDAVTDEELDLHVEGKNVTLGEPIDFEEPVTTDDLEIELEPSADAFGHLTLEAILEGHNETTTVQLEEVAIYDDPIVVGDDGDTDSIRHAVEVGGPETTVVVRNGTYTESAAGGAGLHVNESVTVRAADGQSPEFRVNGSETDVGVAIRADATLENLLVNASGLGTGLDIDGENTVQVDGATVSGGDEGIAVSSADHVGIYDSTIRAADTGFIVDRSQITVQESTVRATENGTGISIGPNATGTVTTATIAGSVGIHTVTPSIGISRTHLANTSVALRNTQSEEIGVALNYYGAEPTTSAGTIQGAVRYGPFVTDETEAGEPATNISSFAYHLAVDDTVQAVAFPAGSTRSLGESLGDVGGSLWEFDGDTQSWSRVTDLDRTPAALETFVLVPEDGTTSTITVEPASAANRSLAAGWNLVGSPAYTDPETAFGDAEPLVAVNQFDPPAETPAAHTLVTVDGWATYVFGTNTDGPTTEAHAGYFLYNDEGDHLEPVVEADPTVANYASAVGLAPLGWSTAETAAVESNQTGQ